MAVYRMMRAVFNSYRGFQYGGAVFRDIFNEMGWFSGRIDLPFL
jgi:hypothetical protein